MAQPDLLLPPSPASTPVVERVDFWNLIARERGMPEGWKWFSLQTIDSRLPRSQSAASVTGAVCRIVFKSGPRKGDLNWAKRDRATERTLVITFADLDSRMAQWERETGKCSGCCGTGSQPWGRCRDCGGSGLPRAKESR